MTEWVENPELGKTGKPADPKIAEDDDGELRFAVGVAPSGEVFMDFGTSVKWIAFEPDQAIEIANIMMLNAQKAIRYKAEMEKRKPSLVGIDGKPIKKESKV